MSIKIFYTPFRYKGPTKTLLKASVDKIKGPDYSGILYIAPTPRKIRDSKRIFHRLTGGCYIPPEMMTIKQLSKRLYSLYGDRKVISQPLIPLIISQLSGKGIGFASIITDFISEIKQYHPGKEIETISDELKAIFYELGIPEEVSIRVMEVIEIFKAYQELLNKHSTVDENDVMTACPRLIERHNYSPAVLILDGFYELTRSEEAILNILIENAKDILISIPYDTNFSDITNGYSNFIKNNFQAEDAYLSHTQHSTLNTQHSYHPYPGAEEEVEGIVRHIKNCFISGKMRDLENVILTFPKLYEYSDMVARIFRRYGVPYTISTLKPIGKTRPFLDLIALLESVADDYPRLSFSRCLTSPYFKNMPSAFREWIPMLCISSGIIKGKDAWLNLLKAETRDRRQETGYSSLVTRHSSLGIEKGLKWVFKKLVPLESIKNKGNYSQYTEAIIKLLNNLDFSDISTQETDSSTMLTTSLKGQIVEILKELSFIDNLTPHGVPKKSQDFLGCSLRQFIDALKHILNATETEMEGVGVQVMGFLEIRGIEPEYLYFGGLKDGDLPSKPDIDHILPDSVRTAFGLVNLKKYLLLQRFTFYRMIESTRNLHLSYPVMEGDRFFLPSPFLLSNRESEEQVPGIFSREEELLRTCPDPESSSGDSGKGRMPLASYITEIEGIGDRLIKNKFGENSYIRVTDIDSYRTCPRKFFIEKVLKLEPLETKEYKVEAVLLGTIAHEIMQALISRPFVDADDLRVKAEAIIDKLLSDKPVEDYWEKLIKDSFIAILPDIYKLESTLIDDGYSFMEAEVPVEGEVIKGIKLRGKIDRIDKKVQSSKFKVQSSRDNELVTDNVIELIDYKTGTTQFSGPQVITKGATLQLFLYAALMKAMGVKVERAGIYSLKDISLSWIPGRNDRRNGRTIENYIETSLRFLKETVLKMRTGDFSASPLNEQTCRDCSERPYCPNILKTVTDTKMSLHGKIS